MDPLLEKVEKLFNETSPKATDATLTGLSHGDLAQIYVALQTVNFHCHASEEVLLKTIKKRKKVQDE
ncbi:MAG: hypothetical protein DRO87_11990 [Candidatus Thorarchaeota archaeon]|nr:MAG: hypothetical protein DRO87_11990 [Candidatus Thorarchaeota archaeon]